MQSSYSNKRIVLRNAHRSIAGMALATAALAFCAAPCTAAPSDKLPTPEEVLTQIRPEHPRIFLTAETIPLIREYAQTKEANYYTKLRNSVLNFPKQPPESWGDLTNPKYGPNAMIAAFIWLMEGDRAVFGNRFGEVGLERAKAYIRAEVEFNKRQLDAGKAVNWYSISRVSALAAYDWIYDQLTQEEREYFAENFIEQFERERSLGSSLERYNGGGTEGGFYGPPNLPWYVGLAFLGDGINDAYAVDNLKKGYQAHLNLLDYRNTEDGGTSSIATGYAFGMYPFTETQFMLSFNSATGGAIEEAHQSLSLLPNWLLANYIPTEEGSKGWGLGDDQHNGNNFSDTFMEMHLLSIAHFYARAYPERASLAAWVRENVLSTQAHDEWWWPIVPFLVYRAGELPEPTGPNESSPMADYFPSMGAVAMRSGWEIGDTFAIFLSGGGVESHRHFDVGHFVIHNDGFLALDSGSYGNRLREPFLTEYFYRSVAHNTLLIEAPAANDKPPPVWGGAASTLDGGQYRYGGEQVAFTTNSQYTYVATDMTEVYHPDKANEVTRQFVFVPPHTFVIYDRVEAEEPDFTKAWLLHTAHEPEMTGDKIFSASQGKGIIHSRTLLPADAQLVAVGGEGKEYWSAGQNWPPVGGTHHELWGDWRMEVRPGAERVRDEFLHVLIVGDSGLEMVQAVQMISEDERAGVRLQDGSEIYFAREGELKAWWGPEAVDPMGEWSGYTITDHNMNVDTSFGWINVALDPWVYIWDIQKWGYFPRDSEGPAPGNWTWIARSPQ